MNEIEEKFYKTFGIEPKHYDACTLEDKYWNEQLDNQYGTFDSYLSFECPHYGEGCYSTCEYAYDRDTYPEITDRILLELICIYNNYANINGGYPMMVLGLNRNAIKESLLVRFINYEEELKNQVQSLFSEVE